MSVIVFDFNKTGRIDVAAVKQNNLKLRAGLIAPARETVATDLAEEHDAQAIKSMDDIMRMSRYFISKGKYRDNMLFIVGINFGLRVSDLRKLRFCDIISDNQMFKDSFPVFEQKTRNTRKRKRNRYITINDAVQEAVLLYLENTPGIALSDYMFRSESNHGGTKDNPEDRNQPMHRNSIERVLKNAAVAVNVNCRVATHSLRKTFGYHQMVMSGNDPRKLLLLQKIFGHSTAAQTLEYIGITTEEIDEAYRNLNLGSATHNYLDSDLVESDILVG